MAQPPPPPPPLVTNAPFFYLLRDIKGWTPGQVRPITYCEIPLAHFALPTRNAIGSELGNASPFICWPTQHTQCYLRISLGASHRSVLVRCLSSLHTFRNALIPKLSGAGHENDFPYVALSTINGRRQVSRDVTVPYNRAQFVPMPDLYTSFGPSTPLNAPPGAAANSPFTQGGTSWRRRNSTINVEPPRGIKS